MRGVLAAAGAVVVASIARADAPTGNNAQYAPFDQGNTTISDNFTHLTWQRAVAPKQMKLDQAAAYCAALPPDPPPASPWRLPSYKELLTLVDESPHTEYPVTGPVLKWIDGPAFGWSAYGGGELTPVDASYWSSSLYPNPRLPNHAYVVDFSSGQPGTESVGSAIYFRCVHN
jgi:hypothetical protein